MAYWLFKSEPSVFGIDDLAKRPHQTEPWDGVRNYQVRNFLRDQIKVNDLGFFYHSSCPIPGIVGIIKVIKSGYPDTTAFNPESKYYDPSSSPSQPRWYCVDVKLVKKFKTMITLEQIKRHPILNQMQVAKRGNRLSITPVTEMEWEVIEILSCPRAR